MNDVGNAVIELLCDKATPDDLARLGGDEELLADLTGSLGAAVSERERVLEEENRSLRVALIREATLRAELLARARPTRAPRRGRRRTRARGRH